MPRIGLQFVIVVFLDHIYFFSIWSGRRVKEKKQYRIFAENWFCLSHVPMAMARALFFSRKDVGYSAVP